MIRTFVYLAKRNWYLVIPLSHSIGAVLIAIIRTPGDALVLSIAALVEWVAVIFAFIKVTPDYKEALMRQRLWLYLMPKRKLPTMFGLILDQNKELFEKLMKGVR